MLRYLLWRWVNTGSLYCSVCSVWELVVESITAGNQSQVSIQQSLKFCQKIRKTKTQISIHQSVNPNENIRTWCLQSPTLPSQVKTVFVIFWHRFEFRRFHRHIFFPRWKCTNMITKTQTIISSLYRRSVMHWFTAGRCQMTNNGNFLATFSLSFCWIHWAKRSLNSLFLVFCL